MEAYVQEGSEIAEEYETDDKWHGVPPAGVRPAPTRFRYIMEITAVLVIEFIIWGIYRYFTAPIYGEGFNIPFFIGHIIAAPTIHLGPILLYWKFIRKEPIIYKDDHENGKFMSFNLGPFKMTRKRLMTAVLVGLFGGIVWRISEMIALNGASVFMGGTVFGSVTWVDVFTMTGMDFPTFFMMTFVMFFIVGPVEEFEFRSFTHDQSQRVLPKWAALIFSSVFFGFSHIPIALFIYKMPMTDLIFAEISWMAAGATFGALYMWSRNIFAVIVMHGIGNWQLSVYWIQGKSTLAGLTETQGYIQSMAESIIANAFMILVFYLIHKFYWAPQERGEAAFGGKLMKLQQYFFSHDNGRKHIGIGSGALSATTVVVLVVLFSISSAVGEKDPLSLMEMPDENVDEEIDLTKYTTGVSTNLSSDFLGEGESVTFDLMSTKGQIIKKVSIRLTWTDETTKPGRPTIRRYTNQPDTFRLQAEGPNISAEDEQANPVDGQGSINMVLDINNSAILASEGRYNISITLTMVDAGMWSALALLGWNDPGNNYDLSMEVTMLENPDFIIDEEPPEEEEPPEDEFFIPFI